MELIGSRHILNFHLPFLKSCIICISINVERKKPPNKSIQFTKKYQSRLKHAIKQE